MNESHPDITAAPLFTIDSLGPETGPLAPRSVQELEGWLDHEIEYWKWLRDPSRSEYAVGQMRAKQFWAEDEIRELVARYKNNPEAERGILEVIRSRIAHRYGGEFAIHSSSPRAKFVSNIASSDPALAAATAFVLIGNSPSHTDRTSLMGVALAAAYLHGLHTSTTQHANSWNDLLAAIQKERQASKLAIGEANDEWNAQREKITRLHQNQKEAFDIQQARWESEFKVLVEAHTAKVNQIRDALKKDMSLKAAVTYFTEKAGSHSKKAGLFTVAAVAVAGGVVWGAFGVAASVFSQSAQPSPVQIALTLVCGFLALWLMRLLVRILLSNLHLATDLRNRATLVQTYLALLADGGGGLSEKDRALIVGIVFRPVSDGLVRDDGAPPTVFSAVQELFTGGRK